MNFVAFRNAIAQQFGQMQKHPLFRVDVDKTALWETYLAAFPEGTNPIYRERTEHDCSCCRHFIRDVGDVVAIVDNQLVSIWDMDLPGEPAYQAVADAMAALVKAHPIANKFLHYESSVGASVTFEQVLGASRTWSHFHAAIAPHFVGWRWDIPSTLGASRAAHDVMARGLSDLTLDSVDTTLELIAQGSLYRGAEHEHALTAFRKLKVQHDALPSEAQRDLFVWANLTTNGAVGCIRNTVIGSLLIDLSEGRDLEDAVKSFESKVAPHNYKRPTALVTQKMIDLARVEIDKAGLAPALQRRHATLADVSAANVLFADRSARKAMADALDTFGGLAPTRGNAKTFDKVEEVPIERFVSEILPRAETVEVLFENAHVGNLVSLIAPADPTAPTLFKWDNGFSWAYADDAADSIKERVKKAGGSVTGDLCCRLAWDYADDLDFHMYEPGNGHVYYGNRRHKTACGGMLDVDANGMDGLVPEPCENIVYKNRREMKEGTYVLKVHNFNRRSAGVGFTVEVEFDGRDSHFRLRQGAAA